MTFPQQKRTADLYPSSTDTLFYFLFVFFIILGLISLGTVIEAQTSNFSTVPYYAILLLLC